jgi:arylsulfatase A-like enzyme
VVLVALWLALLTGGVELLASGVKRFALGLPTLMTPQIVWMAPLSYALFFAAFSVVLWPLARLVPRLVTLRTVVTLLAFVGAFSVLNVFRMQMYSWALYVLAAGLAYQAGRWASRAGEGFPRLVRRTTPGLVAGVVVLGAGYNGARVLGERRALAALPAPPPDAPNVVLLILDTARSLSMSLYGYERPTTPELDRLAREGVVFDRAVVSAPWSQPSHATLFTGRFAHEITFNWGSRIALQHPTLAEVLRGRGYRTAGFVANARYLSREMGLAGGFIHLDAHQPFSVEGIFQVTWLGRFFFHMQGGIGRKWQHDLLGRKWAPDVIDPLLAWVSRPDRRPFFAMVNFMDVHGPYRPPEPFASRFRDSLPFAGAQPGALTPEQRRQRNWARNRAAYDGSLAYLDQELGRFFRELDRLGLRERTLIVLTSDHGEHFGEHDLVDHGTSLYWPVLHVPLAVWLPGRALAGLRVESPVSLRDIPATVVDLAGLPGAEMPGTSLARFWRGGAPPDSAPVLAEVFQSSALPAGRNGPIRHGDLYALVSGRLHYIRNGDGTEELYDVGDDPREERNLVDSVDAGTLAAFRRALDRVPKRPGPGPGG